MNKSKKSKMTTRELVMVVFLILLLIGVGYYMGFYTPLQQELASINGQTAETSGQLNLIKERSKVGDTIVLTVERDGKKLELNLVLQPATRENVGTEPVQPEGSNPQDPQGGASGRLPLPKQPD